MKNFIYNCSVAVAKLFAFCARDNGNTDFDVLSSPSGITLPESLAAFAGAQQTVTVNFSEGSLSQFTTGAVALSLGEDVIETVTQSQCAISGPISLSFNVSNLGEYTLSTSVSDDQGENNSSSAELSVSCEPFADLAGTEFKFRLDSNWSRVEKVFDCGVVDNRTSDATAGNVVSTTINEWRNSDSFVGGCPN